MDIGKFHEVCFQSSNGSLFYYRTCKIKMGFVSKENNIRAAHIVNKIVAQYRTSVKVSVTQLLHHHNVIRMSDKCRAAERPMEFLTWVKPFNSAVCIMD